MMKSIVHIIILLLLLVSYNKGQNAGNDSTGATFKDTSQIPGSQVSAIKETVYVEKSDTIKIHQKISDTRPEKKQTLTEKSEESVGEFTKWIRKINLFSFLVAIVYILIGIGISKFLDLIGKIEAPHKRLKQLNRAILYIKIALWIIISYSVISALIGNTKEIIFGLLILIFIVITISSMPYIKNLVGGFSLSLHIPFREGDYITVRNYSGYVESILWRATILRSDGGTLVKIPNSVFLDSIIESRIVARNEKLIKIDFMFSIEKKSSEILKFLNEAAISSPYLYNKVKPKVFLLSVDAISKVASYRIEIYTFNSIYETEMIDSINNSVLSSLTAKDNLKS
ncbi:MAG: mechanosensitive ion channel family protein [Ignavibacteriaceae bacterium]